jgi:MFS family permease
VVGFGCGPVFPTALAMINNRYPEARGTASGTLMAIGTLGAVALPWLQGQIGGGQNGGMIVLLIVAILMLGIFLLMQRQAQQASLSLPSIGESESSTARGR